MNQDDIPDAIWDALGLQPETTEIAELKEAIGITVEIVDPDPKHDGTNQLNGFFPLDQFNEAMVWGDKITALMNRESPEMMPVSYVVRLIHPLGDDVERPEGQR
jgi:hypothetical protein